MSDQLKQATCACGAITVNFSGDPRTTMLCACKDCQKATGAGHSALALFDDQHTQIRGETKSFSVVADSGAKVARHFCPTCGTPIFGTSERVPGHKLIPAGLSGEAGISYSPKSMIFARSQCDWDVISPQLPKFEKYKESKKEPS